MRDASIDRFKTALLTAILITSATILPLLSLGVTATPVLHPRTLIENSEYPKPELCLGNCTYVLDPSIVYEDGVYWRFSTAGNIAIATAPELEGPWEYKGSLLDNGTSIIISPTQDIWVSRSPLIMRWTLDTSLTYISAQAPAITKIGDTFYCHYAVSWIGLQNSSIGVATSQSLDPGTWQDHGSIDLPLDTDYNLIDPYVFHEDPEGPIYFTFGSYWSGVHQIEMTYSEELLRWSGSAKEITNIVSNNTVNHAVVEGATMYKYEDFYYIFFSVGRCCNTERTGLAPIGDVYHVAVCRSDSVTGPFYDQDDKDCLVENGGTTILASHGDIYAPGGQDVLTHPENGRTVMVYHYRTFIISIHGEYRANLC